ncbi:MAG: hypothetical protein HGA37_09000, partial [Lentimicrobium sp.]|nr:hypothetical protein [Lentimicrobium sp.]
MNFINFKTLIITLIAVFLTSGSVMAQKNSDKAPASIKWMTLEEAVTLSKKKPKMIFIDIYTDW